MKCRVQYVRLDLQIDAIISSATVAVRKKYLRMPGYQSITDIQVIGLARKPQKRVVVEIVSSLLVLVIKELPFQSI